MTDEQKRRIEYYLPNPRDTSLDDFDYYVKDINGRIFKVHIVYVNAYHNELRYSVYTDGGKHITSGSQYGDFRMYDLYDNKQDCKDDAHWGYDEWEQLRKIQQEEQI